MRDVKISAADRQTYDSWPGIMKDLISPFGILFLIFLVNGIAGSTPNEPYPAASEPRQQEHGALAIH